MLKEIIYINKKPMFEDFNKLAIEFLTKLENEFQTESKIKTFKNKFKTLQLIDSKSPVVLFMSSMQPFGEQILGKDEIFFRKDEYINNAENISGKIGLVEHWDSTSDEVKDSIWFYVQALYVMGMLATNKNEELQSIIDKTGYRG